MKKILFPARGLNRDRCIPLCTTFSRLALGTELRRLNGLRPFKFSCLSAQSGDRLQRAGSTVVCGFFAYKKILGRIETRTRDKKYLEWMRSV